VNRFLQDLQLRSRVSLKKSFGISYTTEFAAWQAGQVKRIAFPARVPVTSFRGRFFMMVVKIAGGMMHRFLLLTGMV